MPDRHQFHDFIITRDHSRGWRVSHPTDEQGIGLRSIRPSGWCRTIQDAKAEISIAIQNANRDPETLSASAYLTGYIAALATRFPGSRAEQAVKLRREKDANAGREREQERQQEERNRKAEEAGPDLLAALKGLLAAPTDAAYEAALAAVAKAEG